MVALQWGEPAATTPSQMPICLLQATPWDGTSLSLNSAPSEKFHNAYGDTISLEKESRTKTLGTKQQLWLNREMHRRLKEISRGNKGRLFSHYTFILNGEALGWEAAGELPRSAGWKTASVTSFQIRHQEADSSPRPRETTLTKIYTGD